MTTKKKATVTKKVSPEQRIQDALDSVRWKAFIKASGLPFENVTDDWWNFFEAQSDPASASTELVRLIDIAIQSDMEKFK